MEEVNNGIKINEILEKIKNPDTLEVGLVELKETLISTESTIKTYEKKNSEYEKRILDLQKANSDLFLRISEPKEDTKDDTDDKITVDKLIEKIRKRGK